MQMTLRAALKHNLREKCLWQLLQQLLIAGWHMLLFLGHVLMLLMLLLWWCWLIVTTRC